MFVWTVSSCLAQIVLTPTSVSEDFKFNHNHYKFFNSYWCLPSFIFHSFITVVIGQCNLSSQLNPPITELITITIATTTYPKKNKATSKMEEYLTKDIINTTTNFSHVIFYHQPDLSTNRTVCASCF